jgi:UDP-MurNAc hydroxylase
VRVTFLGHAGLKIETDGATLLCDPWLSPEGAFQASWFQFPENSHLVTPELFEPTALVISHEHLDHVDPWFLVRVPAHVPVIIFRFPSPVLRRKILAGGERPIIEADAWERIEVGEGTTVFFVPEPSPMNHDVGVVIEADGQTLLNLNDARLAPIQFREIMGRVGGTIDLFALQGAGASWYPMCYDYPDERQRELSRQKRLAKFAYMTRAIKVIEPRAVLPFAGPPCFLDPELQSNNSEMERGIFPDQQQVATWLTRRGIVNVPVLLPGDAWDVGAMRKDGDVRWSDFSFGDRWRSIEAYADRRQDQLRAVLARYPEPTESLWDRFRDYFERLLSLSPYFNRRIGMRVGFDITGPGGGAWAVDFRPGSERVYSELDGCAYRYSFASRWARPLIDGDLPWEDFFLSLRFRASRDPDLYNDHLLGLLKHANPESLDAVERFEASLDVQERILIRADGRTYSCQRYCPHAGNDLLDSGDVLPGGVLRCLAHHYEFSLETGECLNGTCGPLEVERVD